MLLQNVSASTIVLEINGTSISVTASGVLNASEQDASSILNNYTNEFVQLSVVSLLN